MGTVVVVENVEGLRLFVSELKQNIKHRLIGIRLSFI